MKSTTGTQDTQFPIPDQQYNAPSRTDLDAQLDDYKVTNQDGSVYYHIPAQALTKLIADLLGVSRPTLNKWIEDPEQFTVGAVIKSAELRSQKEEL